MRVLINRGAAPFRFSQEALKILYNSGHEEIKKNGKDNYKVRFNSHEDLRYDKKVIKIVEKLGSDAGALLVELKIIDMPKDVKYYIQKVGNSEEIHEEHRIWK